MCGRFLLKVTRLERLEQALAGQFDAPLPPLRPRFNIAPSQDIAIVRRSLSGTCELSWVRWGLVPSWSEEPRTPYSTINARAETVDTKPAFRSALRHRRCLIPADGWYEWERKEKRKLPWVFHRKDGGDFAFAGLWEHWARGDQVLESCSIIVTAANRVAAAVHDRMPVILPPERYADWLDPNRDPASLKSLLVPCPDEWLASHRVGLAVNSAANDFPSVVAPVEA